MWYAEKRREEKRNNDTQCQCTKPTYLPAGSVAAGRFKGDCGPDEVIRSLEAMSLQLMLLMVPILSTATRHGRVSQRCGSICQALSMSTSPSPAYSLYNEGLDSPRYISAPMVEQSELAFRLLTRRHGADLAYTQMIHARNFMIDPKYRADCIDWLDYSSVTKEREEEARRLDRPLIIQFAGDDPTILVEAAKHVHEIASAVDLNLGCPQKIAKRGNYGAYLLNDQHRVCQVLSAMVRELKCPVTAKIRRLQTDEETIEMARAIQDTGVSLLTLHGRTAESSKLYTGNVYHLHSPHSHICCT